MLIYSGPRESSQDKHWVHLGPWSVGSLNGETKFNAQRWLARFGVAPTRYLENQSKQHIFCRFEGCRKSRAGGNFRAVLGKFESEPSGQASWYAVKLEWRDIFRCSRFTSVEMTPRGNEANLRRLAWRAHKLTLFTWYPPDWSPIARVGSTTFVVSGIMNWMPKDLVCLVGFQTNINKRQAVVHQPRFSNRRSKNAIHTSWTSFTV